VKPLESFLADKMEEFVTYREHLGYAKRALRPDLRAFDRYLKQQNLCWEDLIEPAFFLELRTRLKQEPRTVNRILSGLRSFFQYLVRQSLLEENSLRDLPPLPESHFIPFVFSPEETEQLLQAVSKGVRRNPKQFLADLALYVAIVLLARCGMRIKEPIRLLHHHYRSDEGSLYIEKTKFKKDRLIPVPKAALSELENYLAVRRALIAEDSNPYLLAWRKHRALNQDLIRSTFHQGVRAIGLRRPKQKIGDITFGAPTPHSQRHSFAINTLKRIRDEGKSAQHALPVLATYLGHRKYRHSAAYLKVSDAKDVAGLLAFAKSHLEYP
jgi:integrase/recombinase XerD